MEERTEEREEEEKEEREEVKGNEIVWRLVF